MRLTLEEQRDFLFAEILKTKVCIETDCQDIVDVLWKPLFEEQNRQLKKILFRLKIKNFFSKMIPKKKARF